MKYLYFVVALLLISTFISCTGSPEAEDQPTQTSTSAISTHVPITPTPEPTATPEPALAPTSQAHQPPPTETPPPPPTPTPEPGFGDGTYIVGQDIEYGLYAASSAGGLCYWERLSGFGGTFDEIIANGLGGTRQIVDLLSTDAGFSSQECGRWLPISESVTEPTGDGTWLVNEEWAPGTYRAPGGESCYWERMAGFLQELDDIIANDFGPGPHIVTIEASDAGFQTTECGKWERVE